MRVFHTCGCRNQRRQDEAAWGSTRLKRHAQSGSLQTLQQRAKQQVRHPRAAGGLHRRRSEASAQPLYEAPAPACQSRGGERRRVHGAGHEARLLQGRHAGSRRRADGAHTRLERAGGLFGRVGRTTYSALQTRR